MLTCFFQSAVSFSQPQNYSSIHILTGKVISNYPTFPEVKNPSLLVRFRMGNSLTGFKSWHRYYNYPDFGINIVYGSMGNKNVLGNILGVTPEMILKQQFSKKISLSEGIGLGLSYFNKKYDEATNPTNIAIGSHLAAFGSFSLMLNYAIDKNFAIAFSANLLHSSNSHIALPNLGANIPAIGVGVRYQVRQPEIKNAGDPKPLYNKKIHFNIKIALGLNEQGSSTSAVNGPKFPIYITSLFVTKKFSYVNKLQFGVEGYYNTGVYDFIISQNLYSKKQKEKSYAGYIFIGHEYLIGHFSLAAVLGGYFYNPFYRSQYLLYYTDDYKSKLKTTIVMKLGMQYYFWNAHTHDKNQLYIGSYVKTNFGQADFWENAIGWQF